MTVAATQSNMPMGVKSHKNKGMMKQEELREVNLGKEVYMHQYFLTVCKIANKMKLQIFISIGILMTQASLL